MKNKKILIMGVLGLIVMIAGIMIVNKTSVKEKNEVIQLLSPLLDEQSYQSIVWDMSPKEVNKIVAIQKDEYRVPQSGAYVVYNGKTKCTMDGVEANVSFEFVDNKLTLIQLYFETVENADEWFEKQVESFGDIYGVETEKIANSSDIFSNIGFKWDREDTSLQFVKMTTNSSGKINIILSVGKKMW